jgi:hypothetical protein
VNQEWQDINDKYQYYSDVMEASSYHDFLSLEDKEYWYNKEIKRN